MERMKRARRRRRRRRNEAEKEHMAVAVNHCCVPHPEENKALWSPGSAAQQLEVVSPGGPQR